VTVCPNDAFFNVPTGERPDLDGRQQYFVFVELCNECGNCLTFCPEHGDPAVVKPRLFLDPSRFEAADGPRFLLATGPAGLDVTAAGGAEAEVPTLASLLAGTDGLPLA
jgi:putative selenate reductase